MAKKTPKKISNTQSPDGKPPAGPDARHVAIDVTSRAANPPRVATQQQRAVKERPKSMPPTATKSTAVVASATSTPAIVPKSATRVTPPTPTASTPAVVPAAPVVPATPTTASTPITTALALPTILPGTATPRAPATTLPVAPLSANAGQVSIPLSADPATQAQAIMAVSSSTLRTQSGSYSNPKHHVDDPFENPYLSSYAKRATPNVLSYPYAFVNGVATVLTLFTAISFYMVLFAVPVNLGLVLSIAFFSGLIFMYRLHDKIQLMKEDRKKAENDITVLREGNRALQQKMHQLIFSLEKAGLLNPERQAALSPHDRKMVERIQGAITGLAAELGASISKVVPVKKTENRITKFVMAASKYIRDMGLTVGSTIFAFKVLMPTLVFIGYPLLCTLLAGLIMPTLALFCLHRRQGLHAEHMKLSAEEKTRLDGLKSIFEKQLGDIETAVTVSERLHEKVGDLKCHESSPADQQGIQDWLQSNRATVRHGYYKGKFATCRRNIHHYLLRKDVLHCEPDTRTKRLDTAAKTPRLCFDLKNGRFEELADADLKKMMKKSKRLDHRNRNIETALKMLLLLDFVIDKPALYDAALEQLRILSQEAKSHSPWSLFFMGQSRLAKDLKPIFDSIDQSSFKPETNLPLDDQARLDLANFVAQKIGTRKFIKEINVTPKVKSKPVPVESSTTVSVTQTSPKR